jgi:hypothetical protein
VLEARLLEDELELRDDLLLPLLDDLPELPDFVEDFVGIFLVLVAVKSASIWETARAVLDGPNQIWNTRLLNK